MNNECNFPKMKSGYELISELTVLPEYDRNICNEDKAIRLLKLMDIYKIYIPSDLSFEIYTKLYFALIHSLNKKETKQATVQHNENRKAIIQKEHFGILGGSDSFTIIGVSGIGKSSAIERAVQLISNDVIQLPQTKVIPFVTVQCPFDSSVKGLLLEILRKIDETLNTNYYAYAVKARATTDMLIGSVSQASLNHIGVLVVDEIQNVTLSRYGNNLVGMLTQLINNSGISICMVGTPEVNTFFEQKIQLARRALGLKYEALPFNDYFKEFAETVFSYQYTKNREEITNQIIYWLYEHSAGITSVVISLIHDAQEIAILEGKEILDIEALNKAYEKRLSMLHDYVSISKNVQNKAKKNTVVLKETNNINENIFSDCLKESKENNMDIAELLKEKITVEEISI